jgi:hypothetical protein
MYRVHKTTQQALFLKNMNQLHTLVNLEGQSNVCKIIIL